MSEREFQVWAWWFSRQKESPSLTDYYLMQIAALIYTAHAGQSCEIEDMKLKWTVQNPVEFMTEAEKAELVEQAKQDWMGRLAPYCKKRNSNGNPS